MHSPFDPISKSYFPLEPQLPDDFRGRVLRGGMMSSYSGGGSQIILQTVEQPEFSLQFSIIRFFSAIRMIVGEPAFKAGSLLAYKGNIHLREAGQNEIRNIFNEMNAIGMLFPSESKMKLMDLHVHWRNKYHTYWFKKWFRKIRRKI